MMYVIYTYIQGWASYSKNLNLKPRYKILTKSVFKYQIDRLQIEVFKGLEIPASLKKNVFLN